MVGDELYGSARAKTNSTLEDVAALSTDRETFTRDDGTPEETVVAQVTPNFFRLLGARVVLGRDFTDADGLAETTTEADGPVPPDRRLPTFAIASREYFERRRGNPKMLGQPVEKNGPILVAAPERGVELLFRPDKNIERHPDLWTALRLRYSQSRLRLSVRLIGRLRRGVALAQAQAQADAVAKTIRAIEPVYRGAGLRICLEPMQSYLVASIRPAILALMGAVIFLLLIACSNVANLFLVRASLKGRDLAVRTAMGATWWRLCGRCWARRCWYQPPVRFSASDSPGQACVCCSRTLRRICRGSTRRVSTVSVLRRHRRRTGGGDSLRIGSRGPSRASRRGAGPARKRTHHRTQRRIAFAQYGSRRRSGAVLRPADRLRPDVPQLPGPAAHRSRLRFAQRAGLWHVGRKAGFKRSGTVGASRANARRPGRRSRSVEGVTAANWLPLDGEFFSNRWGLEDAVNDVSKFQSADMQAVLPGYFATMRTHLLAGRVFDDSDNKPGVHHMIVDDMLAAKAFPGRNAVGKRILSRINTPTNVWYEIVGVVAHQRLTSLAEPGREQMYLADSSYANQWAVRTRGDPEKYAGPVRAAMAKFDSSMLLTGVETMDAIVERAQTGTRFSLLLIASFAIVAALLAGVGLYGVLSTVVRQRTAEIGVRLALGSEPGGIFRLMVAYGLRLSAAGIAAGLIGALFLTRAMSSMLIGIEPADPLTFAAMIGLFLLITVLATAIPARRAALYPLAALREE